MRATQCLNPSIKDENYSDSRLFHAVDWYPTILGMAGVKTKGMDIDGINQWPMIRASKPSKRREFVYNINSVQDGYAIR